MGHGPANLVRLNGPSADLGEDNWKFEISGRKVLKHPQCHATDPSYSSWIDIHKDFICKRPHESFSFGDLRYTPITCQQAELVVHDNVNYEEEGLKYPRFLEDMFNGDHYEEFLGGKTEPFRLRFVHTKNRRVNVFIGMTMYQEPCGGLDDIRFEDDLEYVSQQTYEQATKEAGTVPASLIGVLENLKIFNQSSRFTWDNVVVCLIADGRTRINQEDDNLKALNSMGAFFDLNKLYSPGGMMESRHRVYDYDRENFYKSDDDVSRTNPRFTVDDGMPVFCHLFENIIKYKDFVPIQFMFALKELNAGKLDSHLWFFEGFAHYFYRLQKEEVYCVTLDAGTRTSSKAIVRLIERMEGDSDVAGVCGQIAVAEPLNWRNILNIYVASQTYEYKVGNFLDKSFEAFFGSISVLPGAFSAYRWTALSPPELGAFSIKRPIVPYFTSCTAGGTLNPFYGNMYLAEDRVLCNELVCGVYRRNKLSYVPEAEAMTDCPRTLAALMKQRRRWLNGSFFAQAHGVWEGLIKCRLFQARHSFARRWGLVIEYVYFLVNLFIIWFLNGLFYAIYYSAMEANLVLVTGLLGIDGEGELGVRTGMFWSLQALFIGNYLLMLSMSLRHAPDSKKKWVRYTFTGIANIFMILTFFLLILIFAAISQGSLFVQITSIVVFLPLLLSILHCEFHYVLITQLQSFITAPVYILCFQLYAFCNTHDLSWGTKGLDTGGGGEMNYIVKQRKKFRNWVLLVWGLTNIGLICFFIAYVPMARWYVYLGSYIQLTVLPIVLVIAVFSMGLRVIGSILFICGPQVYKSVQAFFERNRITEERKREIQGLNSDDSADDDDMEDMKEEQRLRVMITRYRETGLQGQIPEEPKGPIRVLEPDDDGKVDFSDADSTFDQLSLPDLDRETIPAAASAPIAIAELLRNTVKSLPEEERASGMSMLVAQAMVSHTGASGMSAYKNGNIPISVYKSSIPKYGGRVSQGFT